MVVESLLGLPQQVVEEIEVIEEMDLGLLEVVTGRLDLAWPYLMGCMLHMAD